MFSKSHTKYIQSLQHKKSRGEEGVFIAEGPKLVPELLREDKFICKQIFATAEWIKANNNLLKNNAGEIISVKDFELEKLSSLTTANEVLAVFEQRVSFPNFSVKGKITLILDGIQDPGNFGTIIRIADWFGVENIVCSENCADMYNSKVVQSTMGSIGRVNLIYTNLVEWLNNNKTVAIYAAALQGKSLAEISSVKECILIIGNESKGISEALMQMATDKITISKKGSAESLNAAVATGIILSHLVDS